jgi:hypothetical protein
MGVIKESDWKYLRDLKKPLLDRLCNRILDNIQAECSPERREPDVHEQYIKIYRLIKKWDKTVADCFNNWRRSDLILNILFLIKHQVMTDEEIDQLSADTKEQIKLYLNR